MDITINVKKAFAYDEVAKLTGYVGSKTVEDTGKTYDRVFTTDDDKILLERFWREACNFSTDMFKRYVKTVTNPNIQVIDDAAIYTVVLSMPSTFDTNMTTSIEETLNSYFVNAIASKWFAISSGKDISEFYKSESAQNVNEVESKIYFRKRPTRVIVTP